MADEEIDEAVRLAINVTRLGEADMRNWWGSRAFGAAGRVVLKQRLPRTWRMAAVELDLASATNRHNETMSRTNAIHLFSDNWPVRRWAAAWVAEQKTAADPDPLFEQLESATLESVEVALSAVQVGGTSGGGPLRVGTINREDLSDPAVVVETVRALGASYVGVEPFVVPYFEVSN